VSVDASVDVSVDADVSVGGGHRRGSGKDGRRKRTAQGCKRDLAARVTDRRNDLQRGGSGRGTVTARERRGGGSRRCVGVALGISGEGYSSRLRQASPW
jgi:hypothetical protein